MSYHKYDDKADKHIWSDSSLLVAAGVGIVAAGIGIATALNFRYHVAKFLNEQIKDDLSTIILGVINGESRVLSVSLTIDQMFSDREEFRNKVVEKIQDSLGFFGLQI